MDTLEQAYESNQQKASSIRRLLKSRWFLGITVVLILVGTALFFFLFNNRVGETETGIVVNPAPTAVSSSVDFSPEQMREIREQHETDGMVGDREVEIKTKYPWFIKLPLRGEQYFVYFVRDREVFVGRLYPKSGDDIERMKAEIRTKLRDVYNVAIENYRFEWKVIPE